ncbi:hypothetical protein Scep_009796 [Stephania cephalantha]|uniref:JmjC domain-containing protein n=1 Tax=Stephania cephalantha TaxID=152367 RepID=A0AAP0JW39_9MAGN
MTQATPIHHNKETMLSERRKSGLREMSSLVIHRILKIPITSSNLQIFFDYYAIAKPPISKEVTWLETDIFTAGLGFLMLSIEVTWLETDIFTAGLGFYMLSVGCSGALELNQDGFSPIRITAINGDIELVRELLKIDSSLCSLKDRDERTPIHLAAMKGRLDVMGELLLACPESAGETVELLLNNKSKRMVEVNAKNLNNLTAMDQSSCDEGYFIIGWLLLRAIERCAKSQETIEVTISHDRDGKSQFRNQGKLFFPLLCFLLVYVGSLLIGIEPWTFVQQLGEAVFIPAGCPHQVRNLKAASGTKGGSSGSPVIDWQGQVVALNAGSKSSSASAFFLPFERHSQGVVGGGAGDGVGPMVVFSETEIMYSVSDPFLIRDGSETECKNSVSDPFLISNGSETELMHSVSDPFLIRDGSETECKNSVSDPFLIRDGTETECIISVSVPNPKEGAAPPQHHRRGRRRIATVVESGSGTSPLLPKRKWRTESGGGLLATPTTANPPQKKGRLAGGQPQMGETLKRGRRHRDIIEEGGGGSPPSLESGSGTSSPPPKRKLRTESGGGRPGVVGLGRHQIWVVRGVAPPPASYWGYTLGRALPCVTKGQIDP